eukprot:6467362-Amphidinium_carterae.2
MAMRGKAYRLTSVHLDALDMEVCCKHDYASSSSTEKNCCMGTAKSWHQGHGARLDQKSTHTPMLLT